MQLAQLYINRN